MGSICTINETGAYIENVFQQKSLAFLKRTMKRVDFHYTLELIILRFLYEMEKEYLRSLDDWIKKYSLKNAPSGNFILYHVAKALMQQRNTVDTISKNA